MEDVRPWQLRTHWLAGYGIPRTACRLARSGDPVAKLLIDTSQAPNVAALTDQIRAHGAISRFAYHRLGKRRRAGRPNHSA
jgi:hypothetical protein